MPSLSGADHPKAIICQNCGHVKHNHRLTANSATPKKHQRPEYRNCERLFCECTGWKPPEGKN